MNLGLADYPHRTRAFAEEERRTRPLDFIGTVPAAGTDTKPITSPAAASPAR
jgi:hypothetical protein